ncbi:MAG TPA: GNAT family N-acetyltransferase [Jatrophihabitans sp.]|nr:GNAT family N-acetyltransferase [Jatrophihabitans sp.]
MTAWVGVVDEAATRELRRQVLRPALALTDPLPGDELSTVVHLAAVDAGTVVCTCFVYRDPCPWLPDRPAWHLRQMATLPGRRGAGHGRAVVEAAAAHARDAGAEILWCNARETAAGFYQQVGFTVHGETFTDAQHRIPHRRMWRELAGENESASTPRPT